MGWKVDVDFRPSPIHGIGVFARTPILAGTVIWTFDETMHASRLTDLAALPPQRLAFALLAGYFHHPSGRFVWYEDGMQYLNHGPGAAANIGAHDWPPLESDHTMALRDIAAGEELREDYAFWSIFRLPSDHWLHGLYRDFCPEHYAFLADIDKRRRAA